MVLFVYTAISPLTNFILAFCFLFLGTMLRHQFIYVYPTVPDSGGKIWANFIRIFVSCMIVAQITSTLRGRRIILHQQWVSCLSFPCFLFFQCSVFLV
jgi:hypothetical protein